MGPALTPDSRLKTLDKVLVINTAGLGDVILSTALPREIKKIHPGTEVHFLVWEAARTLLERNSAVAKIWTLNKSLVTKGGFAASWSSQARLALDLRREGFSLVLDLSPNGRTLIQALASGAANRATIHYGWRTKIFYHLDLPLYERKYQGELGLDLLRKLGFSPTDPSPDIVADPGLKAKYLTELGGGKAAKGLGIHPGGGWPGKFWPLEYFQRATRLLAEKGYRPVILYGPGEENLAQACAEGLGDKVYLPPLLDLPNLIALISCCQAVLSNDSGPRHMAAGLGLPTVGLFGPTWPVSVIPPGGRHLALRQDLGCGPCDKVACADPRCLREIRPEDAVQVLLGLLA